MRHLLGVIALFAFGTAAAAPVTIDFEGVVSDIEQLIPATPYVENSFQIVSSDSINNGIFGKDNTTGNNSNGTAIFGWCADGFFCSPVESITLTNVDSNPFSLLSFDASQLRQGQTAYDLIVTGNYAAGGGLSTTISLTTDVWQNFAFSSAWTGLSSVVIQASGPGSWDPAIDNIRVNAVPVPAAVWLFASGLGLLGWMKRKQR